MKKRKTHYQVKGVKLRAVRDAKGRFLDIVKYKNEHRKDLEEKKYDKLQAVLNQAFNHASRGKGKERHDVLGENFEDQPIMWIEKHFKSFQLGQAVKKVHESQRLSKERAVLELLGAINYLAAKVIDLESN